MKWKEKTRAGYPVKLLVNNGPQIGGQYPIWGWLLKDGEWNTASWSPEGKFHLDGLAADLDLVPTEEEAPKPAVSLKFKDKTRNGTPVRIFATDGGRVRPIIGAIMSGEEWVPASWTASGRYWSNADESTQDLIPEKISRCVSLYRSTGYLFVASYKSRAESDEYLSRHPNVERLACVEITEGDGL